MIIKMKKLSLILCVFISNFSFAQINSIYSTNGSITISPKGLQSKFSGPSADISNVALGPNALKSLLAASTSTLNFSKFNTGVGSLALTSNTRGSYNTAMGFESLKSNTSGKDNSAFGYNSLWSNTYGLNNTAFGSSAMYSNTSGSHNTSIGFNAMKNNVSGSNNTSIGYNAGPNANSNNLINTIAVGYNAQVAFSNSIRMGDFNITTANIQVAWTTTSDVRWKENIKNSPLGLTFINDLRPVLYHRKNNQREDQEFGLIAQELETVLKNYGYNDENLGLLQKDPEGYYSVRYNDLIPILVKAVQEQQAIIQDQKAIIQLQNSDMQSYESRLEKLEEILLPNMASN